MSDKVNDGFERLGETDWSEAAFVGFGVAALVFTAGCFTYVMARLFI